MKLIFATHNAHKAQEIEAMIPQNIELLSLKDIGCFDEIPEEGATLVENATSKAQFVHTRHQTDCFADDTGLEVEALNNAPGVYSARYAGPKKCAKDNIDKLLLELKPHHNRAAQFRTVIALYLKNELIVFEGVCKGTIAENIRGHNGFGYDAVFIPEGYNETFAELPPLIKNSMSHRTIALKKLVNYIN